MLGGHPLDDIIAADPEAALGARVAGEYGNQLPFLVKLLAAGEPLSIQAHPSREQAQEGFSRENSQNIALDDSRRNYKDPNHKPELIVALTPFRALAGFRPTERTQQLFATLGGLDRYSSMLVTDRPEEGLRAVFTTLISLPTTLRMSVLNDVKAGAETTTNSGAEPWIVDVAQTFLQLTDRYPGDVGALAALMLNLVTLEPGEALYLDAGQPHAYLSGLGVEVMANSDNVLRGGLTSKHVDVPELARVLNFAALERPHAKSTKNGGAEHFELPIEDFRVSRHTLANGDTLQVDTDGPAIVLCTAGRAAIGDLELQPAQAAWIPAAEPSVAFTSTGDTPAELFLVSA